MPEYLKWFRIDWLWCWMINRLRRLFGRPPSVSCWLRAHPNVANAIKWQVMFQVSAYDIPETAKRAWPNWSSQERARLDTAFDEAWEWMQAQSGTFSASAEGLPYPPVNVRDTTNDNDSPWTGVSAAYAWDLFTRWIALELVVEIGHHVPWSVTAYNDEQLQVLFDSAAIMSRLVDDSFTVATGSPGHGNYVKRKDNLGASLIAPPRYTYAFLANGHIIGASRIGTIGNLLQWVRDNLVHYYGAFTYLETGNHWQYRGNPPITGIIEGTINPAIGAGGQFNHWTAGCHGTTGFIRNVLRAANIPVHISTVCGHSQACFITEGVYLDHGDDPYNSTFKSTGQPAAALLIDHNTYVSWFGPGTDNRSDGCDKIGHQVNVLAGN
ncbi:hypothetical protein [Sulfurisoma sediminicola]|uniref:Uncharacterized protein n=1 Tax=Sulfurisoma sediminicola TaxID=1381557 RepID=A0A497XCK1_9PROT|nr:hypothetical protein [Sulfurisoma sediminicola]RLJ64651.1 hypothetical protein DFR35_1292 [Sulfurisoma sediminicola]